MDRYEVVVVGAGLAGLTCSRWLAERGSKVLLVDRNNRHLCTPHAGRLLAASRLPGPTRS